MNSYRYQSSNRITNLAQAFGNFESAPEEIRKYLPIALIACIEGFARGAIKELCDKEIRFLENALKIKQVKLDIGYLSAIQNKRVTAGDLIAHVIPLSSLEAINNVFGEILGCNFFEVLSKTEVRGYSDTVVNNTKVIDDPGKVFRIVKETFEMRHIFAHEVNASTNLSNEFLTASVSCCSAFMGAISNVIDSILYSDYPLTQADMNQVAFDNLQEEESALKAVEDKMEAYIRQDYSYDLEYIEKYNSLAESWKDFVEKDADFQADLIAKEGTMRPAVYASTKASHYKKRAETMIWLNSLDDPIEGAT